MRRAVLVSLIACLVLTAFLALPVLGYSGISSGNFTGSCGCHSATGTVSVTMSAPVTEINPGQQVAVSVAISGATSNSGRVGIVLCTPTGGQPSSDGWSIVQDPSQSTSYNCYVDMAGASSGTYSWTLIAPTSSGTHSLTAKVALVQNGNKVANSPAQAVSFNVAAASPTGPSVSITSPSNGATVKDNITVNATVTAGASALSWTRLAVDGIEVANQTSGPYSFIINTWNYSDGVHVLTVTASDVQGNQTSSQITVTVGNQGSPTPVGGDTTSNMVLTIIAGALVVIAAFSVAMLAVTWRLRHNGGGK